MYIKNCASYIQRLPLARAKRLSLDIILNPDGTCAPSFDKFLDSPLSLFLLHEYIFVMRSIISHFITGSLLAVSPCLFEYISVAHILLNSDLLNLQLYTICVNGQISMVSLAEQLWYVDNRLQQNLLCPTSDTLSTAYARYSIYVYTNMSKKEPSHVHTSLLTRKIYRNFCCLQKKIHSSIFKLNVSVC